MLGSFKIANFNVDQVFGEFIGGNSTLEDGQTITLFPDIQPKYLWVAWVPPRVRTYYRSQKMTVAARAIAERKRSPQRV